jgi:hypothetical protein
MLSLEGNFLHRSPDSHPRDAEHFRQFTQRVGVGIIFIEKSFSFFIRQAVWSSCLAYIQFFKIRFRFQTNRFN